MILEGLRDSRSLLTLGFPARKILNPFFPGFDRIEFFILLWALEVSLSLTQQKG
jgi:hypothetical protein